MAGSPTQWVQAERLDAARLVEEFYDVAGVRLQVEGPAPGGEVGAAFVRWERDGVPHQSVLKWRPNGRIESLEAGPLAACEVARQAGIPAPATELISQIGHAAVILQERLPGAKIDRLSSSLLDQALSINEQQAGLLQGRSDIPAIKLYLREDGPGFCLHEPLRQHSRRTADLERWVRQVEEPESSGNDLVHLDFHPGNLLEKDGVITGVVDWDGAGRGDRRLDLVTLRFGVHRQAGADVISRLDDLLDQVPTSVLNPLWAHLSLRMVDWAIRHHTEEDVLSWLDLAGQRS
jgi:hypothetical protein